MAHPSLTHWWGEGDLCGWVRWLGHLAETWGGLVLQGGGQEAPGPQHAPAIRLYTYKVSFVVTSNTLRPLPLGPGAVWGPTLQTESYYLAGSRAYPTFPSTWGPASTVGRSALERPRCLPWSWLASRGGRGRRRRTRPASGNSCSQGPASARQKQWSGLADQYSLRGSYSSAQLN